MIVKSKAKSNPACVFGSVFGCLSCKSAYISALSKSSSFRLPPLQHLGHYPPQASSPQQHTSPFYLMHTKWRQSGGILPVQIPQRDKTLAQAGLVSNWFGAVQRCMFLTMGDFPECSSFILFILLMSIYCDKDGNCQDSL